jgi:hypothetical protein
VRVLAVLLLATATVHADWDHRPRIVLLFKKPVKIERDRFIAAAQRAFGKDIDVKRLKKDFGLGNKNLVDLGPKGKTRLVSYEYSKKRFWDEKDRAAENAPDARARATIFDHRGWFEFDCLDNNAEDMKYRILCRMVAELLDENVLAIHFPLQNKWVYPDAKDLKKKLRAKQPLVELKVAKPRIPTTPKPKTEEEKVIFGAIEKARARFDQFETAFTNSWGELFVIKVGDPRKPTEWHAVSITRIKGELMIGEIPPGSGKRSRWIKKSEVVDWSYLDVTGKVRGNFVLEAIKAWALAKKQQKKKGK